MRITEALEKGHPRLTMKGVRSDVYAFIDSDGVFKWNHTNLPVRAKLLIQDWLPYEPEKCEACKEADKLHAVVPEDGCFLTEQKAEVFMSEHLRKYHCTCKKEAP